MKNHQSQRIAKSVLSALLAPEDVRKLQYMQAVVLCGLPWSGKSTVASLLSEVYGFERLSSDMIRTQELFRGQEHRWATHDDLVMQSRYKVYEELAKRAQRLVLQGKRAVIDGTNMDDKRLTVLGGLLSAIPGNRVAVILFQPPEWIMRRRFELEGDKSKRKWYSVYKYWRIRMKKGESSYISAKQVPQITMMKIKRYSIQTFDWVPDIKAIVWDMDGTFYQSKGELKRIFDDNCITLFAEKLGVERKKAETEFWKRYQQIGSKTKTLESIGLPGRETINQLSKRMDYAKYIKHDKRLLDMFGQLKQFKHYILTNAGREETLRKMACLGLKEHMFEAVYVSHELPYDKPDERIFKLVGKRMKMKPGTILTVGDREETDIVPALKAGMHTAMVWGKSKQADVSFKSVYEVAELFGMEG